MSWIKETKDKAWYHRLCTRIIKTGPVPKHVAFIMDGNRRFAKKNSMVTAQGHLIGFDKLAETLEWCLDLGITEVTVYAFSIENFKRSKEEVDGLMELSRKKFARLMEEKDLIEKHGVCFRVLGNLTLLPLDIQEMIAKAVQMTKHNDRAILNVCFSYTARDEICAAMREVAEGVQMGLIKESDLSEAVLDKCMYTSRSHHPDLLVRTSGEVRLSDFLLWQSCYSVMSFVNVLWPEFSIWHLYAAVLQYQKNHSAVKSAMDDNQVEQVRLQKESDHQCVMEEINKDKANQSFKESASLREKLESYSSEREIRVKHFLEYVEEKRDKYFEDLVSKKTIPCVTSCV